jgi:hypothetical protein
MSVFLVEPFLSLALAWSAFVLLICVICIFALVWCAPGEQR